MAQAMGIKTREHPAPKGRKNDCEIGMPNRSDADATGLTQEIPEMAYYLSNERNGGVVEAYHRYQQYLRENGAQFPRGAFALATAEWYQNPSDHRCPHDAWLENCIISETEEPGGHRSTTIRIRLRGAYHDGHSEIFYPRVFNLNLNGSSERGLSDWLYDEFRLLPNGHIVHEIEWSGQPGAEGARWLIEASDVEFRWQPDL